MHHALSEAAIALWRAHGGPEGEVKAAPLRSGRNSRVVRLMSADGRQSVVAKRYFDDDGPSRLHSEWTLLRHAEELGSSATPRTVARDDTARLGLYEFVPGRHFKVDEIGEIEVMAAASFVRMLNSVRCTKNIQLPEATESAFTIFDQFVQVDRRFSRLSKIGNATGVERAATDFVSIMYQSWLGLKNKTLISANNVGLVPGTQIAAHERVISPSDFGFHNALRQEGGRIVFIDFEYAGWDDIAKLAADFFFQPQVPPPSNFFRQFVDALLVDRPEADRTRARIALMRPIFGLKWCCILLNIFVPGFEARARFADPDFDLEARRREQLKKAQQRSKT